MKHGEREFGNGLQVESIGERRSMIGSTRWDAAVNAALAEARETLASAVDVPSGVGVRTGPADARSGIDIPIGAVVFGPAGEVLGSGHNEREANGDPMAHAEVLAMRRASARRGTWNLSGCTLAVTLEPCPMCAGAAVMAHVERIVFGAWDVKLGACGSVWDIPRDPHMGAHPEVIGGVEEDACRKLLEGFFATQRPPFTR